MKADRRARSANGRQTVSPGARSAVSLARLGDQPEGITGDELISFVNNEEAVHSDGTKGAGLFAYLRGCRTRTAATAAT